MKLINIDQKQGRKNEFKLFEPSEGITIYIEKISQRHSLYVFGAGHVARPIVEIAAMVDFRTAVLDDRDQFANRTAFPTADEVIVLKNFDRALDGLQIIDESFVVIVTRGHNFDQRVLEQVLATPAAYIGMIGSRTKVANCFRSLKEKGFDDDQLARVHAPIGLEIGSETPAEIAVSIVAQLIQVRSQLGQS